ncbi:hypothetical protein ACFYXM_11730 [Streptomyces sp. NPDC002476]|uniref:hypothetical protein n=1 Tax=Streptomyces sp. NPDC002476 TaxID=3364648 RepID=UPI0036B84638
MPAKPKPTPEAVEAVQVLENSLAQAIADPTVPIAAVEAVAWNVHNLIKESGSDAAEVFRELDSRR